VKKAEAKFSGPTFLDLMADYYKFCEIICHITYRPGMLESHPLGGSGPLLPTEAQRMLLNLLIRRLLFTQEPVRVIVLKGRQLGCTTVLLALWLWLCLKLGDYHVMFIIDKDDHNATKRELVFSWLKRLEELYPGAPKLVKKTPHISLSNGSLWFYESAEAGSPGTSEMLHVIHKSEVPKWPRGRASQIDASLMPALPIAARTCSINESTAQGLEEFYIEWMKAQEDEESGILPVFIPWYLSKEYNIEAPPGFSWSKRKEHGDGDNIDEQEYARLYKLSKGQILWRRHKINSAFKGSRVTFDQEYPTTPDHAWRNSVGGNYFGKDIIDFLKESIKEPLYVGDFANNGFEMNVTAPSDMARYADPKFVPSSDGDVKIWYLPHHKRTYYLGGDSSEGKEVITQKGEKASDYTCFQVIDDLGALCATFKARIKPEESWIPLLLIATFYGAMVNCERNTPGATLWSWFKLTGYTNNLVYMVPAHRPYDERTWTYLAGKTLRGELLANLRARLAACPNVHSESLYSECTTFVDKNGKPQSLPYAFDDEVMSLAHAYWAQAMDFGTVQVADSVIPNLSMPEPEVEPPVPGRDRPFKINDTNLMRQLGAKDFGTLWDSKTQ
jgi:hypothetical protein